jgi:hypothetical protein
MADEPTTPPTPPPAAPAPAPKAEGDPIQSPEFGPKPPQLGKNDPVPEPPSLYGDPEARKAKSDELKAEQAAALEESQKPPEEAPQASGATPAPTPTPAPSGSTTP